jgi:hypothetical protein
LYLGGVLLRYSIDVQFMSLVTPGFPDVEEMGPQDLDQLFRPRLTCVGMWSFSLAIIKLLVIDNRLCDSAAKKVLPSYGLLVDRRAE